MSETITKDGVNIEVFTIEELETQKQEAIENYKSENPDKADELASLQEELRLKEEELTKVRDKDTNFANLRKQKEAAEKKITDITAEIDTKISAVKKEVMEGVMKDHYEDSIKRLVGDDKELRDKLELHYKRLGDSAGTKAEVDKNIKV